MLSDNDMTHRSCKVGLITIHDTLNFGSTCQAFALYKAVEKLGYRVELIDYKNRAIRNRERTYRFNELRSAKDVAMWVMQHRSLEEKRSNIWQFFSQNINISKKEYTVEDISSANSEYDAFLVGSDIVWGMDITGGDYTYFLDFADDDKIKLAFSSSIGKMWPEDRDEEIGRLLRRFDAISVREQIAAEWLQERLNLKVKSTCDPTMLWNGDFWGQYANRDAQPKDKYVLVYFKTPDEQNIRDGIEYAKKIDAKPVYLNFGRKRSGIENVKPMSVGAWLGLIKDAEAVFSASFHGLLFSLYFHRNVFYYNWVNKSRMTSLAKDLQIEFREGSCENVSIDREIDYTFVDEMLENKRDRSLNVLKSFLLETSRGEKQE